MPQVRLQLHIPAEEMLDYYRGLKLQVFAIDDDGRSVRFPASILKRFVTTNGVHGRFMLDYDAHGKFVDIHRIDHSASPERTDHPGLDNLA